MTLKVSISPITFDGFDEVKADGRMGECMALGAVDDVGGGGQEPAGLAFQRQVLRHQAAGKRQGGQSKAANGQFAKGAEIQVQLQWSAVGPASGDD